MTEYRQIGQKHDKRKDERKMNRPTHSMIHTMNTMNITMYVHLSVSHLPTTRNKSSPPPHIKLESRRWGG